MPHSLNGDVPEEIHSFRLESDRPEFGLLRGDILTTNSTAPGRVGLHRCAALTAGELLNLYVDGHVTPVGDAPSAWEALRRMVAPRALLRLLRTG